jgi:ketosteroid isomerase-like protein
MSHHVGMTPDSADPTESADATGSAVRAAEDTFFHSLLARDTAALRGLLTDDFAIVDVLSGDVTARDPLVEALDAGVLTFVAVERDPAEVTVRHRPGVAVVVGRTRMSMTFAGQSLTVASRYTHVYVLDDERWRLLSAQGTPVGADGGAG